MKRIKHILIGWAKVWGLLPVSQAEAALSALRLMICSNCVESAKSKVLQILPGSDQAQMVDTLYCKKCSCPCKQKAMVVDESCPLDKW